MQRDIINHDIMRLDTIRGDTMQFDATLQVNRSNAFPLFNKRSTHTFLLSTRSHQYQYSS